MCAKAVYLCSSPLLPRLAATRLHPLPMGTLPLVIVVLLFWLHALSPEGEYLLDVLPLYGSTHSRRGSEGNF
jgi:hypothetical protein